MGKPDGSYPSGLLVFSVVQNTARAVTATEIVPLIVMVMTMAVLMCRHGNSNVNE